MNYFNPNFYQNYPYGNNQFFNQIQPQQPPPLNGKVVDTVDMVKATEVPIGGFGIFPKADLNEIYVKSWNQNGTTSVVTYKPFIPEPAVEKVPITNDAVLEKINNLESKIDAFLQAQRTENKKEINISDY